MAEIIVLGAGMVGVSTALALQARGHQVLLADRRGIGRETSYGNAGIIQTEAVEPYGFPRDIRDLLKIATKTGNDVNWHLASLPEFLRPLLRYWETSAPVAHQQVTGIYRHLIEKADLAHAPLIEASGSDHLIERSGYRCIFRTEKALAGYLAAAERCKAAYGVDFIAEDSADLAAAEPNMKLTLPGAVRYSNVWTCLSPGALTAAYGRLFQARGGRFVYADAQSLTHTGLAWALQTEEGPQQAEAVVVALGPWSAQFAERFGYHIPMLRKRGYHRHYPAVKGPAGGMMDAERGTFIARMNQGMRLTTGAELTRRDGVIDRLQIRRSEAATRELFDFGQGIEADPWFGDRPFIPDMLPVLGETPGHPGLWLHFGHGHQGFTAGPASAEIFADHFDGQTTALTKALSPRRFA